MLNIHGIVIADLDFSATLQQEISPTVPKSAPGVLLGPLNY